MAVPKQRKTKSRRNQRRMHIHLEKPSLGNCPQCGEKKLTHVACDACGFYKNREIIDVLKAVKKSVEKKKSVDSDGSKPLSVNSLSKKKE